MANEAASRHRVATAVLALLTVGAGFVTDSLFRTPLQPMKTAVAVGGPPSPEARVVTRIALALLLVIPQVSQPVLAASDPVVIKIVAATAQQAEHAQWALARFEAAGLELPSLTIVFYDDYQSCGMREGVLRIAGEDVTIHECQNDPSRSRRSLLHELAHAWDHVAGAIDADTRADFLTLRGLQSWDDDDLPWNQRGEEQTAEIIAWGLMQQPAPIPTSVGDHGAQDSVSLTTAFTLLTGTRPLSNTTSHTRLTPDQQDLVDWAQSRFEQAHLDLPPVDFYFHPDSLSCHGHVGLYYPGTKSLHMCRLDKKTILHELAHAWANINLSQAERASFASYRGLNAWNDDGDVWKERGTEHAAEIIAWALMDDADHVRFTTTMPDGSLQAEFRLLTIDNSRVEALHDGFVELTGVEPVFRSPAEWDSTALETQWQARMSAVSSPEA